MEYVIAIIGSGALSALIAGIFNLIQGRQKNEQGIAKGVRQLLYDRIKHRGKRYIADGSISLDELEDLIEMHTIYHDDLGGNGYLDSLMAQVKKLPIRGD